MGLISEIICSDLVLEVKPDIEEMELFESDSPPPADAAPAEEVVSMDYQVGQSSLALLSKCPY